jgi:hypothetical protein
MSREEAEERQLGNAIRGSLNDYLRRNAKKQNTTIYQCDVCGVKYKNYKSFDKHIMWREFYNDEEYCK